MPPVPFSQRPIIILGAGIIGCATARQLLLNGFRVVVVAEFLPGDQNIFYASAWAGATWHAAGGISSEYRYLQAVTHRHLLKMAQEGPESGVCLVDAREYLEEAPSENSSIWGKTVVTNVGNGAVPLMVYGHTDEFIRKRVESLQELYAMFPESSVFINASGLGSKTLTDVRDDKCFPERGQNVFYRTDKCRQMYFRNGKEYTYVIPRPLSEGVVLGGVKQPNNLSPEVDIDVARDEIARAHRLAPEIVPADPPEESLSYIIGIRPSRQAYGFGGGGYAFSYGIAEALLTMLEKCERENVII
ncbi:hypothetical protein ACP6JC_001012 [Aspergillus fumigatus]